MIIGEISAPNVIDMLALLALVIGFILGFKRGLSGEVARLIGVGAAFALGLIFYQKFAGYILDHTRLSEQTSKAMAFIIIFFGCCLVLLIVTLLFKYLVKTAVQEPTDRTVGGLIGILRAAIFVIAIYIAMNLVPNDYLNSNFGEKSTVGSFILKCMPNMRETVPEKLDEGKDKVLDAIGK